MTTWGSVEGFLDAFGIRGGSEAATGLRRYLELLGKWNRRVNLTASTDWDALEPLFAEAARAAAIYPRGEVEHLDIGSGAGFPALPMRILRPRMRLTLVEPRARRAAFLETVIAELGLADARVFAGRVAEYLAGARRAPDVVSWKAVRLGKADLGGLLALDPEGTQYWLFHGETLPLEPGAELPLPLLRRLVLPERPSWVLSIFGKNVSRET